MKKLITMLLCAAILAASLSGATFMNAGEYQFSSVNYGDADGNGSITLGDVSLVLKHIANWTVEPELTASDVNADGRINLSDVALMLKYIAKWDVIMGIDGKAEQALLSGDSEIRLRAEDERLLVTYLATVKSGNSYVSKDSAYAIPERFRDGDGSKIPFEWKYDSAAKVYGTDNGVRIDGLAYTYKDAANGFEMKIYCLTRESLAGPFEFRTTVTNTSGKDVTLEPSEFSSVSFEGLSEDATVFTVKKESLTAEGYSDFANELGYVGGIYEVPLEEGKNNTAWVNTNQSGNANGYLPMIYVNNGGENGVYTALEWSSGRVIAKGTENGGVAISVDMDRIFGTAAFMTKLCAGDTFNFPGVYYGAYDGSIDDGANVFKSWFFDCKAPATLRDNANEPQTQMDMQIGLDADKISVEAIKWDYGWFSTSGWDGKDSPYEGSWILRNPAYIGVLDMYGCKTMAEFGQLARDRGLSWTVYTLLHDTVDAEGNPTDEYGEFNSKTHPEWFSDRKTTSGVSADLGNAECVDYLKGAMVDYFKNNNITTWRSDFEPICYKSDKSNRHFANGSDVMYWCTVGFGDLVDHIYENVPGFRYESCSSGGSMKDLFTATKAVVINCDDSSNYLSLRATFYDSTYVIHPTQLQIPVNADTFNVDITDAVKPFHPDITPHPEYNAENWKDTMLDMGYRSMIMGAPMFSSHTGTINREYIKYYSEMYQNVVRPLARDGELYHILPRPDGVNWDGMMYADPDSESEIKGMVFLFKPNASTDSTYRVVMDGLDESKTYELSFEDRPEQNCTVSGAVLMSEGIDVEILGVGSELIFIREAK